MDNGASSYRRFLDGDEEAFNEIMELLFHSVVFFADRYVHDTHAAEDIAIDVFSDLVVRKRGYNFKVQLKTYLFMLARSRSLDYIKHRKIINFTPLSDAETLEEEKSLEETVLADEKRRAVNAAISQLPQEMQEAIHLVYFEELSYRECARIMKKSEKQIDNLLYRAKGELRAILGKESFYENN